MTKKVYYFQPKLNTTHSETKAAVSISLDKDKVESHIVKSKYVEL